VKILLIINYDFFQIASFWIKEYDKEGVHYMDFKFWRDYFAKNNQVLSPIPWGEAYEISADERAIITKSIQQFQIGESSEGKHLIHNAKNYSQKIEDPSYLEAIILFIKEEQRHARDLARFMTSQNIPLIKKHWVDQVFRKLRKFAGLELSIIVLVTAEIIAKVYYKALKNATKSKVLINLCERILDDEVKHVEFQSLTLHELSHNRATTLNKLSRCFHWILMQGTIIVVWIHHRKVLRAGGYHFTDFFASCKEEFYESDLLVKGRNITS
jgi:hypothetical protein